MFKEISKFLLMAVLFTRWIYLCVSEQRKCDVYTDTHTHTHYSTTMKGSRILLSRTTELTPKGKPDQQSQKIKYYRISSYVESKGRVHGWERLGKGCHREIGEFRWATNSVVDAINKNVLCVSQQLPERA